MIAFHQAGEIRARRAGGGEVVYLNAFEAKLGDGLGDGARKSGRLSDRREILQLVGKPGGVDNSIRQRLGAKVADGS
jgi:hypothetical protein